MNGEYFVNHLVDVLNVLQVMASNADLLQKMNPMRHFGEEQYLGFWYTLFATVLKGFWGRVIAIVCTIMSLYWGVRRQRFFVALTFLAVAIFVMYGGGLLKFLGLLY